jgi:Mn2+/Fe2+ NRAMP family transporter
MKEIEMRILAIALLAAGILALVYGGFSFTQRTHEAKVGPVEISMNETRRVNVPVWAGVVFLVVGAGLLFVPKR